MNMLPVLFKVFNIFLSAFCLANARLCSYAVKHQKLCTTTQTTSVLCGIHLIDQLKRMNQAERKEMISSRVQRPTTTTVQ